MSILQRERGNIYKIIYSYNCVCVMIDDNDDICILNNHRLGRLVMFTSFMISTSLCHDNIIKTQCHLSILLSFRYSITFLF